VRGRDAPLLAQFPGQLEPAVDWLAGGLERLPVPVVQSVYRRAGWADAITARQLPRVRSDRLAEWVVRQYPRRRYPVVFIGSSNGGLTHLAAALGAPWLPQTLLLAVRHGGLDPDDPEADMRAMVPAGRALAQANPDLALHHMHDPVQDRLMIARMTYFRVSWPTTTVGDRHVFQFGRLAASPNTSSVKADCGSRGSCASRARTGTSGSRPRPTASARRRNGASRSR
jgi:hypothetical protein